MTPNLVCNAKSNRQTKSQDEETKFEIVCNYHYLVIYFPQLLPDTDTKNWYPKNGINQPYLGPRELIALYTDYLLCW